MKFLTRSCFVVLPVWLSACSMTTIAPIEQLQKQTLEPSKKVAKSGRDTIKEQSVAEYLCDDNKIVRVQPISTKKNSPVMVIFNHASYKLSPTVSSKGKKYSNIRWIWLESFNGKATLRDHRHKVLAKNCVKK